VTNYTLHSRGLVTQLLASSHSFARRLHPSLSYGNPTYILSGVRWVSTILDGSNVGGITCWCFGHTYGALGVVVVELSGGSGTEVMGVMVGGVAFKFSAALRSGARNCAYSGVT
jgi:hypothetical protein